jgi:septal ring factor EnvC (AmiA/AmiB activator)
MGINVVLVKTPREKMRLIRGCTPVCDGFEKILTIFNQMDDEIKDLKSIIKELKEEIQDKEDESESLRDQNADERAEIRSMLKNIER